MHRAVGIIPRIIPLFLAGLVVMLPPSMTESFRVEVLCEPAARLAATGLGCPLLRDEATDWPILFARNGSARVTPDCAGLTFLMISFSLACWHLLVEVRGRTWFGRMVLCVVLAGAATLLLNTARILVVVTSLPLLKMLSPPTANLLHVGLGVMVFLPGLIIFSILLTRFKDCYALVPAAPKTVAS